MNRKTFLTRLAGGTAALAFAPATGARLLDETAPMSGSSLNETDLHSWKTIRKLFPLTRDRIYFNTGGLGPPSMPVLDAMREQALRQAEAGETYHDLFNDIRIHAAKFIGASGKEVAFVRNATEGNSLIAAGLRLERGDEVIFDSHAHPGGSFPWLVRQKEDGIRVRIFEPDPLSPEENIDRIFSLVNERTKVIQVSHLTAPTGILFDVKRISAEARKRGIWFHIDGAQSAGMIPVNLGEIGCDSYATSGHKWMNGPQESGLIYIAEPRIQEVACSHAGAYSDAGYELPDTFAYNPSVQRHEYGTRDAASIVGLRTAIELQERIGKERIANHGKDLVKLCRRALEEIDGVKILTPVHPEMHNSIITFKLKGWPCKKLAGLLTNEYALRVRNVSERGLNAIRISWHVYNDAEQIGLLCHALRRIGPA